MDGFEVSRTGAVFSVRLLPDSSTADLMNTVIHHSETNERGRITTKETKSTKELVVDVLDSKLDPSVRELVKFHLCALRG